ncbi:CotY/CotZ family spore coat protein [Viridibacillus arvi]|uniref:CotY/CotZ family spore coat protein n=1 Tax=Viridibacillus arvi TaxID=263475 RepID=UPI0006A9F9B1|nr:CotY/CotZ family spore coat protein [Viridibacillus arvi]
MIDGRHEKKEEEESVCNLKPTLEKIYEAQNKAKLPIFRGILQETIPFILYSAATAEPYFTFGTTTTSQSLFRTCFFRIEDLIDSNVSLSLLRPFDIEGNCLDTIHIPYRLEKTNIKVIVSIHEFSGIQCISPKLIDRQSIIVEQKC